MNYRKLDYLERISNPKMSFYRRAYGHSRLWDGDKSLNGKRVIVYGEQGVGDIIQFAGYFRFLKELGCHTIIACSPSLHRLFLQCVEGVDEVIDKFSTPLPPHDFHILSLSFPFIFPQKTFGTTIHYDGKVDLAEITGRKIGIAWEGNPEHTNNNQRVCPLKYFKAITGPKVSLVSLQKEIHLPKLLKGAEDMELFGTPLNDYLDTAALINALDDIVCVDTSVLHLAGAMGKRVHGLISFQHDPRWFLGKWYPHMLVFKQPRDEDWETVFKDVHLSLLAKQRITYYHDQIRRGIPDKILFTGGIGDVIALDGFFTEEKRTALKKVYLATRNANPIKELLNAIYPSVEVRILNITPPDGFAFYQKSDVSKALGDNRPEDWMNVEDWSIMPKFDMIDPDQYQRSLVLEKKLAAIEKFNLPERHAVIVNCSPSDTRDRKRPFNKRDWQRVYIKLQVCGLKGVVLVRGENKVPNHPDIIDLSNQTTILESLEILKNAKAYYGIDSALSIVAGKLFRGHFLAVKTTNFKHLYRWRRIYYAPNKEFDFLTNKIV